MPHKLVSTHARPAVHSGFLKSWKAGSLDKQVVNLVRDVIQSRHVDETAVKVYITGRPLSLWPPLLDAEFRGRGLVHCGR